MTPHDTKQKLLHREVVETLDKYIRIFETGNIDDVTPFVKFPMTYISENKLSILEDYPFDPARLREKIGFHRSEASYQVLGLDENKAHVNITAIRYRTDDTAIEKIEAVYILLKIDTAWKIVLISGVRSPAPTENPGT